MDHQQHGQSPCCQSTDENGAASGAYILRQITVASAMGDLESVSAPWTLPARCRVSCGRGLNEFPVNFSMQRTVKDVDWDAPWLAWCGHQRTYRLRGHAIISMLIKVAQKLENAVQPVAEWVSPRLPSRTSRRRIGATAMSCQPTKSLKFEIGIFVSAGIDVNSFAALLCLWTTVLLNQQYTVGIDTYIVVFTFTSLEIL